MRTSRATCARGSPLTLGVSSRFSGARCASLLPFCNAKSKKLRPLCRGKFATWSDPFPCGQVSQHRSRSATHADEALRCSRDSNSNRSRSSFLQRLRNAETSKSAGARRQEKTGAEMIFEPQSEIAICVLCFPHPRFHLTRRQSQRAQASRLVLAHASRHLRSWLTFNVRPRRSAHA